MTAKKEILKADAVFEGGDVKGIDLAGTKERGSGRQAAERFFKTRDFNRYLEKYVKSKPLAHRGDRLRLE